jgi:hypothetical protein
MSLDTVPSQAYLFDMVEPEERKVVFLEVVAASAIFAIVAIVLYMVFSYKPG